MREFAKDKVEVYSAGTHPEPVNPMAIKVMQRLCIDISNHKSNQIEDYLELQLDYIITVCDSAKEICPTFTSAAKLIHKSFPDPAKAKGTDEEVFLVYVKVRDMLKSFCKNFVKNELEVIVS